MDPIARMVAAGAAGVSGSSATYVDDVFSTTLYTGNASSNFDGTEQVITTGIDHTEGFLTWIKNRDDAGSDHVLFDSERTGSGTYYPWIYSNGSNTEQNTADIFKSPTSTGFTVRQATSGSGTGRTNPSGSKDMVSWTFRKCPGFFDVVTWAGNSVNGRQISHSLGSVPGMILIKNLTNAANWEVWHNSFDSDDYMGLNSTSGKYTSSGPWNNTLPTSSNFTVSSDMDVNRNGDNYVAYVFAHDDQSFGTNSDEAIIKCGQFEANPGTEVNLGFEPQWVLIKRIDGARDWFLIDNMRGMSATSTSNSQYLSPNDDDEEKSNRNIFLTPTGFTVADSTAFNNDTHIYMAIRRPHKPPEDATDVFKMQATSSSNTSLTSLNAYSDLVITRKLDASNTVYNSAFVDRLRGNKQILTSSQNRAETDFSGTDADLELVGLKYPIQRIDNASMVFHSFKRAPGFMDVVAFTGNGSQQTVSHNLGVVPEMIIVKDRSRSENWQVYHKDLDVAYGNPYNANQLVLKLDGDNHSWNNTEVWNSTSPTSTVFSLGNSSNTNHNGDNYVAYLFASLDGIIKVGEYTGTGSANNVDCGFTAGARFVMIKRHDAAGNWFVFDTVRGITSSSSPWFALNYTLEQQTGSGNNFIDPYNAGFTVDTSISALNANGGSYLFLAIA